MMIELNGSPYLTIPYIPVINILFTKLVLNISTFFNIQYPFKQLRNTVYHCFPFLCKIWFSFVLFFPIHLAFISCYLNECSSPTINFLINIHWPASSSLKNWVSFELLSFSFSHISFSCFLNLSLFYSFISISAAKRYDHGLIIFISIHSSLNMYTVSRK